MRIQTRFLIEFVAAQGGEDLHRKALEYVLITTWRDRSVAVAANGFCLAVVPVELDDGDVPGLVHRSVFDAIHEDDKDPDFGRWGTESFALGEHAVTFEDGWTAPRRLKGDIDEDLKFPDFGRLFDLHIAHEGAGAPVFSPKLLRKLQRALGCPFVVIQPGASDVSPVLVLAKGAEDDGEVAPPVGFLMPAMLPKDAPKPRRRATESAHA